MTGASPTGSPAEPERSRSMRSSALAGTLVIAAVALVVTILVVAVSGGLLGGGSPPVPRFVDAAASAGLVHRYGSDPEHKVGGGVATFDCDDDGRPEIYLAGGTGPAALFHNDSPVGGPLRFTPRSSSETDLDDVTGAYPLDIDGDGLTDLAVLRAGENLLLRGLGDCRFERGNERWGFDGGDARTMAFAATWEGDAALPTLAIGDYIALTAIGTPIPPCPDNELVRPDASGTAYGEPIPLGPGYCPLSMLFSDWDRVGRRDLRISNDRQYYVDGLEQLWQVPPAAAAPSGYTEQEGWRTLKIWGMGIASHDLTGDGRPEVYLTSQGDNKLQTLVDPGAADVPTYEDMALELGVNVAQPAVGGDELPSTAWHPAFEDVNDDGLMDLFVTKGNVSEQEGYATRDPSELLLGTHDGTFERVADAAGIVRYERGRGAAVVDLDLDGLLDIVQVDLDAPVELWHNIGAGEGTTPAPMGDWVGLRFQQPGPNRDAIGSWVEIQAGDTTIQRELTVGGGHISGHLGWLHAGVGDAERVEVRVTWPDGEVGPWQDVTPGGFAIIDRGASAAQPWTPGGD